ncbi:hypothetical protein CYMTET_4282 [Cymbomonas tetramitiformis]|uniref:Uncharacterized protein n=1 Tax=Cymbomonas tetramitiformis TaxID=36881 RepID=A0AAE0LK07_9CHLO|nr:hypothetical protein CYMTET_4282 [Cymbomonas tetramitiformis]
MVVKKVRTVVERVEAHGAEEVVRWRHKSQAQQRKKYGGRRSRRNMHERADGAREPSRTYGHVSTAGYNGGGLDRALRRLTKNSDFVSGQWDVEFISGDWNYTNWPSIKLRYGSSRVHLSSATRDLRGTLRELFPILQRENARLRFSSIEVTDNDRTTELTGKFALLNRSLKDTPTGGSGSSDQLLAMCARTGLAVQIKWNRFIVLIKRLDAFSTSRGLKNDVLSLLHTLAGRLFAWSRLITRDYWITPYSKQDALRFCFSLNFELFASPLDFNLDSSVFFTPYAEDVAFGAIENGYSWPWHFCALGNPIYTMDHIRRSILHAIYSAKTSRKPVRVVLVVPYWDKWDETDGVELICLLKKKKFFFLAPQSALGFKDRSTGAQFEVSLLLIQNRAAAITKPVTQQGLARVVRAFGGSADDRGVMYSAGWGVGFSWQLAGEIRQWVKSLWQERRSLARFVELMKGDVTAGLLLQKLGGKLLGMVEKAAEAEMLAAGAGGAIRPLSEYQAVMRELEGLARGVLDRNVAVGFGVCGKIYKEWLENERDGGNYTPVTQEEAAVVQLMRTKYEAAGLKNVARFDLGGHFGNLYLILKHKDAGLWEKRRPVVPGFASPDRVFQNRLGRILCFLIEGTAGHFNVAATQEIVGQLSKFDGGLKRGDVVMAAGFDVKEMYVRLKHPQIMAAVVAVTAEAMGDKVAVSVNTRGRKGVKWYEPGTPRNVIFSRQQILAGVNLILENGFLRVAGTLVRQTCGIGIGGGASPGLAQCACVYGEMQWTKSLGADRRLTGTTMTGIRLMDDCALLIAGSEEQVEAMSEVFRGYLYDCYPDGMTVEQTSEGLEWLFCGMRLKVTGGGAMAKMTMKNVEAGVRTGEQLQFFPMVSFWSDCGKVQKMAGGLNTLHRIERHCSSDLLKAAAVIDFLRELKWQGYPRGWLSDSLERMVARAPFGFWNRLLRNLERLGCRL